MFKYKGWNDGGVARRFAEMFAAHGIDPGRLELLGSSPHAELLAEYNRIDLALDPFPYSGGLTTCEALWMGVPVITCPGETFASRHSLSHLSNVGLTETIAHDLDEYVELAVSLAERPAATGRTARRLAGTDGRLAALRREAICRQFDVIVARRVDTVVRHGCKSANCREWRQFHLTA